MIKKLFSLVCIAFFFFPHTVQAQETALTAKHAILFEISTGKVLYEKQSEALAPIASITKLLSAYLVYEALENKEITLEDRVAISDYAYELTQSSELSNIPLEKRVYTVNDLLHASLISSANSAMIALAEHVAGSETAFVDRMQEKLLDWDITNFVLVNSTGVSNANLGEHLYPGSSPTDENQLSARDVAKIARKLIMDYPQVLKITSQSYFSLDGEYYYTTNKMLESGTHARSGLDGLKTGTSDAAGASFVATAEENGMRLVSVVLNATPNNEDPDNRFVVTNELLAYGYTNFQLKTLIEKGQAYHKSSVALFNGKTPTATAVATQDVLVVVAATASEPTLANFKANREVFDAPLKKGSPLGQLTIVDKELIGPGYVDGPPSVEMVSKKSVPAAAWPISWWNHFVRYVNENL